jgi:hypothetical protein
VLLLRKAYSIKEKEQIFLKYRFKLSIFQLNLLLLSQISMFGFLEVAFQSLICIFIQIMFAMSKLSTIILKYLDLQPNLAKIYLTPEGDHDNKIFLVIKMFNRKIIQE